MRYINLLLLCFVILLGGCNAQRNVLYLQDMTDGAEVTIPENYLIRLKPYDQITVVVNSKNPELAAPFNSSTNYNALSGTSVTTATSESNLQVLTVDADGFITLPIIGRMQCVGLTRQQLEEQIEKKIREEGYIQDPHVNVRFAELMISIVGEVNKPGQYRINKDQLTIFEALALAGDMTIYGNRETVAVVREKDGKNIITKLDLRSSECFSSPCYYLEQNDVIIVSPNKYKAASAEINQNRSFWISIASTTISLATLILTVVN
ncbi:MAG: polysaccharide export protein [Alistipes sp.]|jgi:polysaccharide export outer membrane protein|nr:polysaccharide export protein [Alistipes sp.]